MTNALGSIAPSSEKAVTKIGEAARISGKGLPWDIKYAPTTYQQVLIPKSIRSLLDGFIQNGMPHLIFYSKKPGTAKTTVASLIPKITGSQVRFYNASRKAVQSTIDEIEEFAKQAGSAIKFVILDEADSARNAAFMESLRSLMTSLNGRVIFILTCNEVQNIPEPIESRCTKVNFDVPEDPKKPQDSLKIPLFNRLIEIATTETTISGGTFDKKTIAAIAKKNFPDVRHTLLSMMETFNVNGGSIVGDPVEAVKTDDVKVIWAHLVAGDLVAARQHFYEQVNEYSAFFTEILDYAQTQVVGVNLAYVTSIVAEHQFKSAYDRVVQELNIQGMFAKIILRLAGK
jgi:DNA polymerase III delta prime subunit